MTSERSEFVRLARMPGSNRRELCRRFGISPPTGYKWLRRDAAGEQLDDQSRRPASSPRRSDEAVEASVLKIREDHPAWGARKIGAILESKGLFVPAVSTIHAILERHGCIEPPLGGEPAHLRFEKERPNQLWQMDFKGRVRTNDNRQLHPLTVIDDHSRFVPGLVACTDQSGAAVHASLERIFEIYGLPEAIFVDNGPPWGSSGAGRWTRLRVWLLKLGVTVIYARPYHPESRGKNERFHRTMEAEILSLRSLRDARHAQAAFDEWRRDYNYLRPHEALDQKPPASRYTPSKRPLPKTLPEPDYETDAEVRRVPKSKDYIRFKGRFWKVPEAFRGETVAIRPRRKDGEFGVYFGSHEIGTIDLTRPQCVNHVSEHP